MKSNLSNYADLLAIPFFILLVIYFYNKKNRTNIENILFLFAIVGLVLDIFFSYIFLY